MVQPRDEIELLKAHWYADPSWDIEDTEGFEEHYDELKAYRIQCELDWNNDRKKRIQDKATRLNCSPELAEYILRLEYELEGLANKIYDLECRSA